MQQRRPNTDKNKINKIKLINLKKTMIVIVINHYMIAKRKQKRKRNSMVIFYDALNYGIISKFIQVKLIENAYYVISAQYT